MELGRTCLALTIAVVLTSCQRSDESLARAELVKIARDPKSVEVRNLRRATGQFDHVVCGEWNARNGFGGMGDWSRFTLNTESLTLSTPSDETDTITNDVIAKVCDGTPYDFER